MGVRNEIQPESESKNWVAFKSHDA